MAAIVALILSALLLPTGSAFNLFLQPEVQVELGKTGEVFLYIKDYPLVAGAHVKILRTRRSVVPTPPPPTSPPDQLSPASTPTANPTFSLGGSGSQGNQLFPSVTSPSTRMFPALATQPNQMFPAATQSGLLFPPVTQANQMAFPALSQPGQLSPTGQPAAQNNLFVANGLGGSVTQPPTQTSGLSQSGLLSGGSASANNSSDGNIQTTAGPMTSSPVLVADVTINGSVVIKRDFLDNWQSRASLRTTGIKVLFRFSDVTLEDEGVYQVDVTVNGVTKSVESRIMVAVAPSWATLFTSPSPQYWVGQAVNFTCTGLAGRPDGHFRLGKGGDSDYFLPVDAPVVSNFRTLHDNGTSLMVVTFQREIRREDDNVSFACELRPGSNVFHGMSYVRSDPVSVSVMRKC